MTTKKIYDDYKQLWNVDCMDIISEMGDESVEMTLTDIPYGEVDEDRPQKYDFQGGIVSNLDKGDANSDINLDLNLLLDEIIRITSGSIYIFCGMGQFSFVNKKLGRNGMSTRAIVYEKTNPNPLNSNHLWLSGVELCVYGKKPKTTFNSSYENTVLRYPKGKSKQHPTEKNLDLFKELIEKSSNEGDIVFDPMCGSATTLIGAEELNRNWIGCEINEEYYNIAKERLEGECDIN